MSCNFLRIYFVLSKEKHNFAVATLQLYAIENRFSLWHVIHNLNFAHSIMSRYTLLFAALLSLPVAAQTIVNNYQPGITPEGITYFLPKTTCRFVITATQTTYHPGDYAEYAERFFGIADAPLTRYDKWTLDEIRPIVYGQADYKYAYTIALNPKSSAPLVTMATDGVLLAINDEIDLPKPLPFSYSEDVPVATLKASDYFTPDILRAASLSKKAELTAEEIMDIRENRTLIAKGQADFNPTDGQQLQLMLQKLDEAEKGLMTMFVGTTSVRRHTFIIDYTPENAFQNMLLFRFSKHLGLVEKDDLSGEPYFLTLFNETTLAGVANLGEAINPAPVKGKKESLDLRYRIPGRGRFVLANSKETVLEFTSPIAQFGKVEHLGGELFNKKFTTHVRLNAITGNIEHIDIPAPAK